MHIQIINFNLDGISRSEYEQVCDDLAQTFADVPGLISKHWLANDDTNTFGGVYMFESKDAYEAFIGSELLRPWEAIPHSRTSVRTILGLSKVPRG